MSKAVSKSSRLIIENIPQGIENLFNDVDISLEKMLSDPYMMTSIRVFLGLYAAFAAPKLPKHVALLMDTTLIRLIFAAAIVYAGLKDPLTAILIAIVFIVTLQTADKHKLYDTSESITQPGGISWLPSAKLSQLTNMKNRNLDVKKHNETIRSSPIKVTNEIIDQSAKIKLENTIKNIQEQYIKNTEYLNKERKRAQELLDLQLSKNKNIKTELEQEKVKSLIKQAVDKATATATTKAAILVRTNEETKARLETEYELKAKQIEYAAREAELKANVEAERLARQQAEIKANEALKSNQLTALKFKKISRAKKQEQEARKLAEDKINNMIDQKNLELVNNQQNALKEAKANAIMDSVDVESSISDTDLYNNIYEHYDLIDNAHNVGKNIISGAHKVGSGVVQGVYDLGDGVIQSVDNMGEGVIRGTHILGSEVLHGVDSMGNSVLGGAKQVSRGALRGAKRASQGVLNSAYQVSSGVLDGAHHLTSGVIGGVQELGDGVLGGVNQFGYGTVKTARHLGSGVVGGVQTLGSGVYNGVGKLGSGVVGGSHQLGSGVITGINDISGGFLGYNNNYFDEHLTSATNFDSHDGLLENENVHPGDFVAHTDIGNNLLENDSSNKIDNSSTFQFDDLCPNGDFTSACQFNYAQQNAVPITNQRSCIQTFENQHCPQGFQEDQVQAYYGGLTSFNGDYRETVGDGVPNF